MKLRILKVKLQTNGVLHLAEAVSSVLDAAILFLHVMLPQGEKYSCLNIVFFLMNEIQRDGQSFAKGNVLIYVGIMY